MSDLVGPVTAPPLIAHVVNSLEAGGLENGVVNLVNVAAESFRHVIICMTTEGSFRARLKPGVEIRAMGKRPGKDLRAFGRLIALLRRLRPAVVHSTPKPALPSALTPGASPPIASLAPVERTGTGCRLRGVGSTMWNGRAPSRSSASSASCTLS